MESQKVRREMSRASCCCWFAPVTSGRGDLCPGGSRSTVPAPPINPEHLLFRAQFSSHSSMCDHRNSSHSPWRESQYVAECHSLDILVDCCYWCDVGKPEVLGDGHIEVLRGGFCPVLVGLFLIGGSLVEALPILSWAPVRLWTWQLWPCESHFHVTCQLWGSPPVYHRSGPLVFPLFTWVSGWCCSYSCMGGLGYGLPMVGIGCHACWGGLQTSGCWSRGGDGRSGMSEYNPLWFWGLYSGWFGGCWDGFWIGLVPMLYWRSPWLNECIAYKLLSRILCLVRRWIRWRLWGRSILAGTLSWYCWCGVQMIERYCRSHPGSWLSGHGGLVHCSGRLGGWIGDLLSSLSWELLWTLLVLHRVYSGSATVPGCLCTVGSGSQWFGLLHALTWWRASWKWRCSGPWRVHGGIKQLGGLFKAVFCETRYDLDEYDQYIKFKYAWRSN